MKLSKLLAKKSIRNVRGQGMSEYLIIVALIAVAGIAVMGLFGGAARNQVAAIANEIGGGAGSVSDARMDDAGLDGDIAVADADQEVNLTNFGGNNDTLLNTTAATDRRTAN